MATGRQQQRETREERARREAVEEARKSGALAPEKDAEGNVLNPHIPAFMTSRPFYLQKDGADSGPSLSHQRLRQDGSVNDKDRFRWLKRGKDVLKGDKKTRFKEGSCKNCGSSTHSEKDCLEKPRKLGAWKTNKNLASDEVQQDALELSYDAARDRWNGYDVDHHMKMTVRMHEQAEEKRRKIEEEKRRQRKEKKLKEKEERKSKKREKESDDDDSSSSSSSSADKDDDEDEKELEIGRKASAMLSTSLRIREDTPKYLRNLDENSAFYDPKTRSMRANPNPDLNEYQTDYAGDNFARNTGDAIDMARTQVFAWDVGRREGNLSDAELIHMQGNPTQVLLARKQQDERMSLLKESKKQELEARYGDATEAAPRPPEASVVESSSEYVEYTPDGRPLRRDEKLRTKYHEDLMEGNHSSVWGSYFDTGSMKWGFACCFQTSRNSYCTGAAGRSAKTESKNFSKKRKLLESEEDFKNSKKEKKRKKTKPKKRKEKKKEK